MTEQIQTPPGKYLVKIEKPESQSKFAEIANKHQQYGKIVQTGENLHNRNGYYVYIRSNGGAQLTIEDEEYRVIDSKRDDILVFIVPS